jgi:ankyrin repeat protein
MMNSDFFDAIKDGDLKAMKQFMDKGASKDKPIPVVDALCTAIKWGHLEIVQYLVQQGVDKDNAQSSSGVTPLIAAAEMVAWR